MKIICHHSGCWRKNTQQFGLAVSMGQSSKVAILQRPTPNHSQTTTQVRIEIE